VIREPEEPPADGGTGRLMLDRAVGPLIGVELLSGLALGATVTALG